MSEVPPPNHFFLPGDWMRHAAVCLVRFLLVVFFVVVRDWIEFGVAHVNSPPPLPSVLLSLVVTEGQRLYLRKEKY